MGDLVVIAFKEEFQADEVRLALFKMQQEYLLELEDAVSVIKNKEGKLKVNQIHDLTAAGAVSGGLHGGFWGLLLGVLFFNPLVGWAAGGIVGAAAGGVSGWLTDIGIDDNFIKKLGTTLQPGNSALFVLVRKATPDKVLKELERFEGKVLRTSLTKDDEAALQEALKAKV